MTRQSTNLPHVRGRSVGGSHKAWRGPTGWQDYLRAKALIAGKTGKNVAIGTAKSMSGLGANRTWPSRIGHFLSWWGLPGAHAIAGIELDKDGGRVGRAHGGRVKGVGKATRGYGRAMRKQGK